MTIDEKMAAILMAIEERRWDLRMSKRELKEAMGAGKTNSIFTSWKQGSMPRIDTLYRCAEVLQMPFAELMAAGDEE